jgi:regulator of protease activity HflC (stomatin/prohibitin superfamily)
MFILEFLAANPLLVVVTAALLALLIKSLQVANQYERSVVFRLGKFNRAAGPGLYFVWPFIEWLTKLDLRTITADVEQQEGITRDNVPIKVDAVIWYRIVDPEHAVMEVKNVSNAVEQVSLTTAYSSWTAHIGRHSKGSRHARRSYAEVD